MRVFSSQFLELLKQLSDQALQIHELVGIVVCQRQDVVFLCHLYVFLFEVVSVFIALNADKLMLLALEESDFPLVRVALKSYELLLFNLIVLMLAKIKHCQLHF